MQKWVIIGIIVSVTIAVGVIVWADQRRTLPVIPAEQQLITKEKAVDIATKKYHIVQGNTQPEFGFLKYNGTQNGEPRFIVYQADPNTKTLTKKQDSVIFYEGQHGPLVFNRGEYFASEESDRFVWILFDDDVPIATEYYVDAKSGEFIGLKQGIGYCGGKCLASMK
jgi:hypothetical protein